MTTDALFAQFENPGAAWRGKPFWAWNGRLDKAELLRQVHVMKEMGLGGFFMHSRVGLATEYLGDDWFECINACADEAEKLGMEAWLYDEDRWPSGSAGGLVTQNPEFRMRFLRCTVVPESAWQWHDGILAAFACELAADGLSYHSLRRVAPGSAVPPGFSILQFTVEEMASSNFYNGYTYLDTMNRAATDAFLTSTHEKYVAKCGDRLGKSIKGIFTDEPHRGSLMTSFGQGLGSSEWIVPWTPQMPEHWEAAYGDDLLAHLPEIFLLPDGHAVHPTKWRYVELCLSLFTENFCKPLDAWCREHNLILTGHFLHEDNLTSQVAMNGSMMRCYEFMEYPGMDLLTEGNKAFWVAKQLQSVGRQLGKTWLMSELYGCTGWQMGLEGHKNIGDWQALFGVNLRCHHLSWYTMEGEAKRDYPASILHQSAWWKDYRAVETYFARLGLLLSQGEPVCDVLVIHPVESVWAQIHPGWCNGLGPKAESIKKLETQFAELFHWLQGGQIDFDYGDEGILAEHASIDGKDFVVGQMRYKTIVIGGCTTIRSTTLKLLEAFAAAGGSVIWAGEKPQFVDAEPFPQRTEIGEAVGWADFEIIRALPNSVGEDAPYDMKTPQSEEIFCQTRRLDSETIIFVCLNTNREEAREWGPFLPFNHAFVEEWNCLTGEQGESANHGFGNPKHRFGKFRIDWIDCTLNPGELKVFVVRKQDSPKAVHNEAEESIATPAPLTLTGPFTYSLDEPNALVLDTATWELTPAQPTPQPLPGGGEVRLTPSRPDEGGSEREGVAERGTSEAGGVSEILKIDQAVRRHFGLEVRGGEMVQPWYAEKFHGEPPVLGNLTLRFTFKVDALPEGPLALAIEHPERSVITINDTTIPSQVPEGTSSVTDFWVDACFKLLPVPKGALKVGENIVTLTTNFRRDSELEACFLLGAFGVRLDGPTATIIPLPETLSIGDVCEQGLPFYTGGVTYKIGLPPRPRPAGESVLDLPEVGGACVRVNGQTIPWPPYTTTLTPFAPTKEENGEGGGERCEPGDVSCDVTVVLTRRNVFGPLHLVPKQQVAYGPGHWVTGGDHWSDHYQLYPSGLLAPPRLR